MAVIDGYWLSLHRFFLLGAVAVSLGVFVRFLDDETKRRVRGRLFLGVPWGTLVVAGVVVCVYLFVQNGLAHPRSPTVVPYRSWSYFYPLGVLVSSFAHADLGHLLGNLVATLTLGALAEYAWGHFPRERGVQTFRTLRTDPFARVGAFVGASLFVAVLTGAFALGPSVGFSGVVFAYAGFALLRYPVGTLVALYVGDLLSLGYDALRRPLLTQGGRPGYLTPWWADIAIQGHALGLFLGALLGAVLFAARDERPPAARVWGGALLFVVSQGLWAVYLPRSGSVFTLYRAVGVGLAFAIAVLLASASRASDRTLVDRLDLSDREASFGTVLAVVLALSVVAVPFNFFVVADAEAGVGEDNSLEVGDYTVFYTESVANQYVSTVEVGSLTSAAAVNASGVIVVNEERHIWWEVVSTDRLAFDGTSEVHVGGLGWRETVSVNRTGWEVVGNDTAATVHLEHEDRRTLAHTDDPLRAEPTVAGRNVTVVPGERFTLRVSNGGEPLGTAALPTAEQSTSTAGLTFTRSGSRLYAETSDTRVRIATRE
ncbi:rhomboid family intramembrane serine protease [Halomarina ordinaria]|uniref:Rhomboid family intramembrane serine protease n=1 Tax=Halomarina ordinaria TaxID=3033939 RepID=A0ABD5UAS4_9EURY|nr:rhomboid family intramembrane serine protease [Halomarina sp. PSRA2]